MYNSKSILIVGAERGLGLGLAEEFLRRGWNVFATSRRPEDNLGALEHLRSRFPDMLEIGFVDVTDALGLPVFLNSLGQRRFDVIFSNAGIWGPLHQSVLQVTDGEALTSFLTNTIGPIRLARSLIPHLAARGALCFMSSHRASIAGNVEGGLEIYRATKAAQNMLARGIYADIKEQGHAVLDIHPGWVATEMGTLNGTVAAEIDVPTSVRGVAEVVLAHWESGANLYLDYRGQHLAW